MGQPRVRQDSVLAFSGSVCLDHLYKAEQICVGCDGSSCLAVGQPMVVGAKFGGEGQHWIEWVNLVQSESVCGRVGNLWKGGIILK